MTDRDRALALWNEGVRNCNEIARRLGRHSRTVWGWINRERHNEYHRRYRQESV